MEAEHLVELCLAYMRKTMGATGLMLLQEIGKSEGLHTHSSLAAHIAKSTATPLSTAKYRLSKLRDSGFIKSGNRSNRGARVELSELGKLVIKA